MREMGEGEGRLLLDPDPASERCLFDSFVSYCIFSFCSDLAFI